MENVLYPIIEKIFRDFGYRTYRCREGEVQGLDHKYRPDIFIFHNLPPIIPHPVALEVKVGDAFESITKGIYDQTVGRYKGLKFKCEKENWEGVPWICFTTQSAIEEGIIYKKHYPAASNFFIERFASRMGCGILLNVNGVWQFSKIPFRVAIKTGEVKRVMEWYD